MSMGEIGGVIGQCEECRHTHGTSSCATCGGGIGCIGPPTLAPCRACLDGIAAASMSLEQLATIATDAGQSPEQAEATALQMLAYATGALPHIREAISIALGDDGELTLVDDETPTEVLNRADVIAQLAPIEETWRKAWIECADMLKSVAEKDPAAAAGYVASCRDWLTRAVQCGS